MKNLSAIIIASSIIIATILYSYFNPYQSCKRDLGWNNLERNTAKICSGFK